MRSGASHPNLKFATYVLLGALAEAFDRCENFIGGFNPSIGFGVLVMCINEGGNVSLQFGGGAVDTPLQLLAREFREPALHLVDPTR